jgi:hypothetical protein
MRFQTIRSSSATPSDRRARSRRLVGRVAASIVLVALNVWFSLPAGALPLGVAPLAKVSGPSPLAPGCGGPAENPLGGVNYQNAEVEPYADTNPTNTDNMVGAWQQDRWSDGGAHGVLTGVSDDGGVTWSSPQPPPFSRCTGGNAANGGDYERATDPWVSFAPNGDVYQVSDSLSLSTGASAILVSKSTDGGHSWGPITTLRSEVNFNIVNDKETVTADATNANYAYAIWDRLEFPKGKAAPRAGEHAVGYRGPTWFSRTTDGGATWEPARIIYDPGQVNQTIGSQIVVLPDGTLVNGFMLINNFKNAHRIRGLSVAVQRSTDKGVTWSPPTIVSKVSLAEVSDPTTGNPVRTGDIIPDIGVDRTSGALYLTWQDSRFSGGANSDVAFSKSTDGGNSWTSPAKVNQTPDGAHAFTPAVRVAADGTVAVTYYDFRADTSDPATLSTDDWIIHSHDGGATWSESHLGGPFDMATAPVARGFFVGDYQGLSAAGSTFRPFFVQANSGDLQNRTDVFSTSAG